MAERLALAQVQNREYRPGMVDFRSAPMQSPEGAGKARRAWDAYARTVNKVAAPVVMPVLDPAIQRLAHSMTVDMLGFWMAWHIYGGFEGLVEFGMHPSTVWRKVKRFRTVFGEHPDTYEFPGVKLDPEAYWEAARKVSKAAHGDDQVEG